MRAHLVSALLVLTCAASASAKEKLSLGVFLPTAVLDGKERFELSEKLGTSLSDALGEPVSVKNFARPEDFAKAAKRQLDVAIIDGWIAAQLPGTPEVLAVASVNGDMTERWAVVSARKGSVKDLEKKRLAIPRGFSSKDDRFASNVIFEGDLDARRHFKLVSVPNAESAVSMLESKTADAALLPLTHADKAGRVMYRSSRLPGVVAIYLRGGDKEAIRKALLKMQGVAPVDRFTEARGEPLDGLRQLWKRGPPARHPMVAASPVLRPSPSDLIDSSQLGLVLPAFVEFMEVSKERPDD